MAALLEVMDYRRVQPARAMASEKFAAWHALRKESTWQKQGSGIQIDLHTRLADNPRLIPGIGIVSPRQTVPLLPGIALPTLGNDHLFAYLCVHGSSSAWFRLKWICDLAALAERSATPLPSLYRQARDFGAGRAVAQALLLSDRLFATLDAAPDLRVELRRERTNRLLAGIAFKQLAGERDPREPTGRPFGTAAIHYSQLLLLPGLEFGAAELWRQGRAALMRG